MLFSLVSSRSAAAVSEFSSSIIISEDWIAVSEFSSSIIISEDWITSHTCFVLLYFYCFYYIGSIVCDYQHYIVLIFIDFSFFHNSLYREGLKWNCISFISIVKSFPFLFLFHFCSIISISILYQLLKSFLISISISINGIKSFPFLFLFH